MQFSVFGSSIVVVVVVVAVHPRTHRFYERKLSIRSNWYYFMDQQYTAVVVSKV